MEGNWGAAAAGDRDEVERMLGEDPGLLDRGGGAHGDETPLMFACERGREEVARLLIDKGADVNVQNNEGSSVLWYACLQDIPAVVKLLVERGADPMIASNGGWTPLLAASHRGYLEVVRLLLAHPSGKATVNHSNEHGQTALQVACYRGHWEFVRALLEAGADPTIADCRGITPMDMAKQEAPPVLYVSAEGRLKCVAELEVSAVVFSALSFVSTI
jgi:ankyrin repeat protein